MPKPKQTVHDRIMAIQREVRRPDYSWDTTVADLCWLLRLAQKHYEPTWEPGAASAPVPAVPQVTATCQKFTPLEP